MASIIRLSFQGSDVSFSEEGWFNATEAAARFGKRPVDWLRLPETERYLEALCRKNEVRKSHFVKTRRGGNTSNQGTWIHPKLAVRFAQWLDIDFAIWCDEQIDALIRGQHPHTIAINSKRAAAHVMTGVLLDVLQLDGREPRPHHFSNEHRLCNFALRGSFDPIDEATLSADEAGMLAKIRRRNSVLIARGEPHEARKEAIQQYAEGLRSGGRQRIGRAD